MRSLLIISILVSAFFKGYTQDYFVDVKKVSERFASDYLTIDAVATAYDLYGNKSYSTKAVLRKSKAKQYTNHLNVEVLDDGKETIMIDHESASITLFKAVKNKQKHKFDIEAQLASIKQKADTILFLGDNNSLRTYRIETNDEFIASIQVTLNYKTHTLTKIVYTYNQVKGLDVETSYSVVEYTKFSTQAISDSFFQRKKYILKNKGTYVPSTSFSHYKIEII